MMDYQKALELFQIKSGFVEEQIESIYVRLKEEYVPEQYEFLSSQYMDARNAQHEILMAYYTLKSYYKTYIVNSNSTLENNMDEEIIRLISDSNGKIDETFIAFLVEIIVGNMNLNDYVRKVEFKSYGNNLNTQADYNEKNNSITFYLSSIRHLIENSCECQFSPIEKEYNPYCQIIKIARHEIEHANHKAILEMNQDNIITRILKATETRQKKYDQRIDNIIKQPFPIRCLMEWKMYLEIANDNRKYSKYYGYISDERLAKICGYNLVFHILEKLGRKNDVSLDLLKRKYQEELLQIIKCGYDKVSSPALVYFGKLKQYKDCLDIIDMSKELSTEERVALGLTISPQELNQLLSDGENAIQKICAMCSHL